jgi:hypothetical protein
MKVGDIVYFKSTYFEQLSLTAIYGCKGGSYEYYFKPGDRYRIDYITFINGKTVIFTGTITNLEDGTSHFAHSEHWKRIITVEEHRELQLNKIGICVK